jgi:hypothetical protein
MRWAATRVAAAIASLAVGRVLAQENASFELVESDSTVPAGWRLGGDQRAARIAADSALALHGQRSLRIESDEPESLVRVTQRLPIGRASSGTNRVALRGYVRAAAGAEPALWLRVDGAGGFLAADSRGAPAALESDGWIVHTVQLAVPSDAREVVLGMLVRGRGAAWFDALELEWLDARALEPPSPVARRYVEAALDLMQQHSIHRRTIDWPAFRAAALEQARGAVTAADAHLAVRFALFNLGDRHSYLQTQSAAAALSVTPVSNARTGRGSAPPRGERLGDVAYLALPGFAGGTPAAQVAFANEVQDLIEALDSAAVVGWVLDLRRNSGGNLWPMLAGVGPLLGSGEAGASVYPDGTEAKFWYEDGKAGFGDYVQLRVSRAAYVPRSSTAPVAVLTDGSTASSAEVLAIAFRARDASIVVGAPTRGLAAGNRTFALSDGAAMVLTVAATRDRTGRVYRGPIAPDIQVAQPRGEGSSDADDAALDAALEWLRGCRAERC